MISSETERSTRDVLAELRAAYPESPFLALGQTVFWDEPVKAVLLRLLDDLGLGGRMVLGVHDTDYFAKTRIRRAGAGRFVLMPHNDGTTRDLWSAAGEVSTLFGSETYPTRHDFLRHGVPFDQIANADPAGRQAFLDTVTEAWGWRGLIYTGSRDLIISRLPLREVGTGIAEMLAWGFENAITQIGPGCCQDEARRIADTILSWCRDYCLEYPGRFLTDLFQHVLPRIYTLLLGHEPANVTVEGTANLLRFHTRTASLPRFKFVHLFLDPATRDLAIAAYNQAVTGTTIYTLDKFGAGALPFDLIVPGRGRGTLRVIPRVVFVETPQPIAIGLKQPITSIQELAAVLQEKLGDQITLVGKAVTLVSMLAQEFIFAFNEEGSLYVRHTRQMNDILAKQGIALDMRPILRMRYATWDSLRVGKSTLRLPEHLAAAFGRATITTPEFAAGWRQVVAEQKALCARLAALRKPRELLTYLKDNDPLVPWEEYRSGYAQASHQLLQLHRNADEILVRIKAANERLGSLRARSNALQQEMGAHFRATRDWTPEAHAKRKAWEEEKGVLQEAKREVRKEIRDLKIQLRHIERSPEATAARTERARIMLAAERARLRLIAHALLTTEGLPHTDHRPSAWWLPMVDASGGWFRQIVSTTQLYTEPLLSKP